MAAPVIASKGTVATTSGATSLSPAAPSGVTAGDLLILFCTGQTNTTAFDTPSNWNARVTVSQANGIRVAIFDRIADGGGDDAPTVSRGGGSTIMSAQIYRITGHAASDYYDASAAATGIDSDIDTTWDIPAFTVANDDSLQLVLICTTGNQTVNWPDPPTLETAHTANADLHVASAERDAGSVSAQAVTTGGGCRKAFVTACYVPAAAPGGGAPLLFTSNTKHAGRVALIGGRQS